MSTTTSVRFPTDLLYSKTGLWVRIREGIATVGITPEFTQDDDVEFIDLPHLGGVCINDDLGSIETLKASITYPSPITGTIVEVNDELEVETNAINNDHYGDGWVFRAKLTGTEPHGLLTAEQYVAHLERDEDNGHY